MYASIGNAKNFEGHAIFYTPIYKTTTSSNVPNKKFSNKIIKKEIYVGGYS